MRPVRFVHTADLHLGARLRRLDVDDPAVRAQLSGATGAALEAVVDLCVHREADFLIIAGDIYDDDSPALAERARFQRAMVRLHDAGIPTYIVRGNHDAGDTVRLDLELPDSVHVFPTDDVERVDVIEDGELLAAVYGIGYRQRAEHRNLVSLFRRTGDEPVAIGVVHTSAAGADNQTDYAPCSVEDLRQADMDYWALGHIHKPGVLLEGYPMAAWAGSPQGLTPNETGAHGCRYVEIDAGTCAQELVVCAAFEWAHVDIDVSTCDTLDDVRRTSVAMLTQHPQARPLVVRIELTGASPAHRELSRAGSEEVTGLLREDLAAAPGVAWVDRVEDRTGRVQDVAALASDQGLVGDVVRSADAAASDPVLARALVDAHLQAVLRSVPGITEEDREAMDSSAIVAAARNLAVDRLTPEGDE